MKHGLRVLLFSNAGTPARSLWIPRWLAVVGASLLPLPVLCGFTLGRRWEPTSSSYSLAQATRLQADPPSGGNQPPSALDAASASAQQPVPEAPIPSMRLKNASAPATAVVSEPTSPGAPDPASGPVGPQLAGEDAAPIAQQAAPGGYASGAAAPSMQPPGDARYAANDSGSQADPQLVHPPLLPPAQSPYPFRYSRWLAVHTSEEGLAAAEQVMLHAAGSDAIVLDQAQLQAMADEGAQPGEAKVDPPEQPKLRFTLPRLGGKELARLGRSPFRVLALHTGEFLQVRPFDEGGQPRTQAFDAINRLMRCRRTGSEVNMDPRLVRILLQLSARHGRELHLISGHRAPKVRGTSPNSQHTLGKAADVRVPRVSAAQLAASAVRLGARGVGLYRHKRFVHIDVRDRRPYYWEYADKEEPLAAMALWEPDAGWRKQSRASVRMAAAAHAHWSRSSDAKKIAARGTGLAAAGKSALASAADKSAKAMVPVAAEQGKSAPGQPERLVKAMVPAAREASTPPGDQHALDRFPVGSDGDLDTALDLLSPDQPTGSDATETDDI
ncbi:MAG: DUF882 domain-containing protein [Proteobacteria bacterium]|nr:DUF882 domain-containing protein [Pseudomonadota bacterium]